MAYQMNYITDQGFTAASSYWYPVQINVCKADQTGNVVFYGYVDKAAREAGKPNIGQKQYPVSAAQWAQFFAPSVIQPAGMDHYKAAYLLAESVLEGPAPEAGQPDTRVSYFAAATSV